MTSLSKDMNLILNRYCKRKSLDEINFDKKQKESGIKLCEHLIHQHSNVDHKKDKLKIITQISHISDNCDTPIPSTDRLLFISKEDSPERGQHSPQISDFFIKSQELAHIKSKSLDNDRDRKLDPCHRTVIKTIVGDSKSNYERVYTTTLNHSLKDNKVEKETSYTRLVASSNSSSNSRPESYYSLPSQIHRTNHNPSNDKLGQINKKKFSTKKIFKRLFSSSKSQKRNEANLKEIDKLARLEAQSSMATPTDLDDKVSRQESKKNNFILSMNQTVPFRSHKIGEKLPPLSKNKKKKKVPDFINAIMTPQSFIPKTNRCGDGNNNIKDKKHIIDISNTAEYKPKRLDAEISQNNGDENLHFHFYSDYQDCPDGVEDDNNVFTNDSSARQRSISGNVSFSHFDLILKEKERRTSCPTSQTTCNCNEKKIDLMVDVLCLLISKKKDEQTIKLKKKEIKRYDSKLCHFIDCNVGKNMKENDISKSHDSWRQSQASLYSINSCLLCREDQFPNILPLLKQLESEDAIDCPIETIEYFIQATCYKHFEQGLKFTIGTKCTMENVALLHYLTRRIVKHIGDPIDDDNKKIKKILKYSEKFYQENYYPHIQNVHKSMENFIVSYNDNDEVD